MGREEWLEDWTNEGVLIDDWKLCGCKYCNPTNHKSWSRTWKQSAKVFRDAYLSLSKSWDVLLDRLYNTYRWSHTWKQSAKKFRAMFLEVSDEWEAERDGYHEALKRIKVLEENEQLYKRACEIYKTRIDELKTHIANMDIELEFSNGLSRTRR